MLDQPAVAVSETLLRPGALVVVDAEKVPRPPRVELRCHALPLVQAAREAGNLRVTNMVGVGALARLGELCRLESLQAAIRYSVPPAYVDASLAGLEAGDAMARQLAETPQAATV